MPKPAEPRAMLCAPSQEPKVHIKLEIAPLLRTGWFAFEPTGDRCDILTAPTLIRSKTANQMVAHVGLVVASRLKLNSVERPFKTLRTSKACKLTQTCDRDAPTAKQQTVGITN